VPKVKPVTGAKS